MYKDFFQSLGQYSLILMVLFFLSSCADGLQPARATRPPALTPPLPATSARTPTASTSPTPVPTSTAYPPTPTRTGASLPSPIPLEKEKASYEPEPSLETPPNGDQQIPLTGGDLLLPDLITLPPTDLRIRTNGSDGHKLLRFTNSIANTGPGKMELWGDPDAGSGTMTVTQYIYDATDSAEKRIVGQFSFHPEHDHWHLGDFALYEVWSVGLDGELDSVVAVSNKISYCLRDDARLNMPDAPRFQTYTVCGHERQGISAGWIDIYRYHLPGQSIDITFLYDGIYALRSTVNPQKHLWEENLENNSAVLYIEIDGNRVRIVNPREVFHKTLEKQK